MWTGPEEVPCPGVIEADDRMRNGYFVSLKKMTRFFV